MPKLLDINIRKMTFTSISRIQYKKIKGVTYLGAFTLSSAHLEFMGLMVMAWKMLRRQVVPMDTPLLTWRT